MKTTRAFTESIKAYLDDMAAYDTAFAERYADPKKNIEDCITYVLNEVARSGCNGFEDDEIYGMAVHYYQEKDIEIGSPIDHAQVVVNHVVELTDKELCDFLPVLRASLATITDGASERSEAPLYPLQEPCCEVWQPLVTDK